MSLAPVFTAHTYMCEDKSFKGVLNTNLLSVVIFNDSIS